MSNLISFSNLSTLLPLCQSFTTLALLKYRDKPWDYLEESRRYLHADVRSLFEVLVSFFTELNRELKINPRTNLSVPGIAFKTWNTHQLPLLNNDGLKVYDLSRTLDPMFREAYPLQLHTYAAAGLRPKGP